MCDVKPDIFEANAGHSNLRGFPACRENQWGRKSTAIGDFDSCLEESKYAASNGSHVKQNKIMRLNDDLSTDST